MWGIDKKDRYKQGTIGNAQTGRRRSNERRAGPENNYFFIFLLPISFLHC